MRVLVTGGSGYIGSHTVLQLLKRGDAVCSIDNHSNSSPEAALRVARIARRHFETREADVLNLEALRRVFDGFRPEAVIHFAGLKAVGESNEVPLRYYENNVQGSVAVLKAMKEFRCRRIVFSSSATVYGDPQYLPINEAHPLQPTNPYGRSKLYIEEIIRDWANASPGASAVLLRYFNPVGADASGMIGEDPRGVPNNLVPYLAQVAGGRRTHLIVYGKDYETRDGTGLRDYIHVVDLARAHLAALDYSSSSAGVEPINVGSGEGVTVLEMIRAFSAASGKQIPYRIAGRRPGDVAASVADPSKAWRVLGWEAEPGVAKACRSAWEWQLKNPCGFYTAPCL